MNGGEMKCQSQKCLHKVKELRDTNEELSKQLKTEQQKYKNQRSK